MFNHVYSLPPAFKGKRITVVQEVLQSDVNEKGFLYETALVSKAVGVLPILKDGSVVLIKSYRHPVKEYLYEAPAGLVDDKDRFVGGIYQTELTAARRELKEETGYTADKWELVGEFYSSPGFTNESITCFFASDLTEGVQELEDTEEIQIVKFTKEELIQKNSTGFFKDLKTSYLINKYLLGLK